MYKFRIFIQIYIVNKIKKKTRNQAEKQSENG